MKKQKKIFSDLGVAKCLPEDGNIPKLIPIIFCRNTSEKNKLEKPKKHTEKKLI
jgi:hypothetical protein